MSSIAIDPSESAPTAPNSKSGRRVSFAEPEVTKSSSRHRPASLSLGSEEPNQYQRRHSGPYLWGHPIYGAQPSPGTPGSANSLATPSLKAVRQYYRENGLHTAFQELPSPRGTQPKPLIVPNGPRRHSSLSPNGLTTRFNSAALYSPRSPVISPRSQRLSIVDESRDILLSGVNRSELERLGSIVSQPGKPTFKQNPFPQGQVPSKPPQDRLRQWGNIYVGNAATADVFVRAVPLPGNGKSRRKPNTTDGDSTAEMSEDMATMKSDEEYVVIRARVSPRAKERKAFLVQRRFKLSELQSSVATASAKHQTAELGQVDSQSRGKDMQELEPPFVRSASTPSSIPAGRAADPTISSPPPATAISKEWLNRSLMPIHMDYALKYLPVLGALMLSGHIRKGDVIDLPLPHPDAWGEAVYHVYTGQSAVTTAMEENIVYLAGTVEKATSSN